MAFAIAASFKGGFCFESIFGIINHMAKVLIVDDDSLIIDMYQKGLERAGFSIITAFNGEVAIERARVEKPDIILMDLRMPVKDGIDATIALKADSVTKDIPVIFLTSIKDEEGHSIAAKAVGAAAFLSKSKVSIEDVIKKVNEILGRGSK